ncbi:hypothetical protein ACET3Z_009031 [Daucus carota]
MDSCERGVVVVVKSMEVVAPFAPLRVHRLPMSNLDLLFPPFDVGVLFFYDAGSLKTEMMIRMMKKGLSQVLVSFYSLAGEVVLNNEGEPEILCNNRGVDFVQAIADRELRRLNLHKLDVSVYANFFPVKKRGVLSVQVTEMKCGGLVIGCSFDHRVADAHSITKFLVAWADMTRSNHSKDHKIASVSSPDYCRSLLEPRNPIHPDPALNNMYMLVEDASVDSPQAPPVFHLQSRIYKINACQLQHLQSLAGPNRTKFEAFSALLWKLLAKAATEDKKRCKLGIVVDGRDYLNKSMENYFGNVLSAPYSDASVVELKSMPLSEIADKVHACVECAANNEHFRGLVDWIECHRPRQPMYKIFSFLPSDTEEVAVVVSSGQHFPVHKMDFGWGHPSVMSVFFPWEGTTGYVMPLPSATDDGDWIVYMHLFERHLDFVEKEAPHIFEPFAFTSPLKASKL